MSRYVLSPRAEADLGEIWDFTVKMWGRGESRGLHPLAGRRDQTVAENPRRGRPCDEVRKGYRQYLAGSHIIFFRGIKGGIDVIRILHGRMKFDQHL